MLRRDKKSTFLQVSLTLVSFIVFYLGVVVVNGQQLICEHRNPEGYNVTKTNGDGGFQIIIVGSVPTKKALTNYIPNEVYTVTIQGLKTRYSTQKFTEFLLVAESEKQAMMGQSGLITTGIFHIMDDSQSRFSDFCPDGVTSSNLSPKSEISVLWTAPSVLVSSCITFKVTLVERPHIWYMDDGGLTKTLCPALPPTPKPQQANSDKEPSSSFPDRRQQQQQGTRNRSESPNQAAERTTKAPDAGPQKCCACDDAKYDIIFEGLWSKETHPKDFPENEWLLHFSDIIGASHSRDYFFWESGKEASEGIRQVAEWGATRLLENEMKSKSKSINTIIKARGLWHPNELGKTSAAFRVDRNHHLMSLVSMIGPSPDWIVGVSGFELCQKNCSWLPEAEFDLYPYDAGVDSGITYMSPNSPTEPRAPIRPITTTDPDDPAAPLYDPSGKPMKPFAKLIIRRQRIYPKNCNDHQQSSDTSHEVLIAENTEEANRPECAVTSWTPWSACSVACGKGLRMRKRSYEIPMKATMMGCDRQLVEKEMCLGQIPTCDTEADGIEEIDSVCAVSEWSEWAPCSVTCGKGNQRRSRAYKNQMGRKKCHLETMQTRPCTGIKEECEVEEQDVDKTNEKDCTVTPWSEWTPCSVNCGRGFRERSRFFLLPHDEPVPAACNSITTSEKVSCVGDAGADCSIGMAEAKEICMLPSETGPCRAHKPRFYFQAEKGMCIPFVYGGCKGNRNRFDTESECLKVCGFILDNGSADQTSSFVLHSNASDDEDHRRKPNSAHTQNFLSSSSSSSSSPSPSGGRRTAAVAAAAVSTEAAVIDDPVIEPENTEERIPHKVDCTVSEWSNWSPCSASCGVGHMVRTRFILVQPQNDGRRCPRRLKKRRICHAAPC